MNFSIGQWLFSILIDLLLKAACLYLLSALTLGAAPILVFMSFALILSMFHFFSLFVASGFVAFFELARAVKVTLTLIVANTLFVGGASLWVVYSFSQDLVPCSGTEGWCHWANGHITTNGVRATAWIAFVLLAINLIPIFVSAALGCLVDRIRRSLQKNRA
jgi:hypothetical protein